MKTYSGAELNQKLLNMDWSPVFRCVSVNDAWRIFKTMFLTVVNEIAPLKTVRLKVRSKPWVNEEILRTIKQSSRTTKSIHSNIFAVVYLDLLKMLTAFRSTDSKNSKKHQGFLVHVRLFFLYVTSELTSLFSSKIQNP